MRSEIGEGVWRTNPATKKSRTFGILSPRNLEELLDIGGFGRHLDLCVLVDL